MSYQKLEDKYFLFLRNLAKINLTITLSSSSLSDFPKNLNSKIRKGWDDFARAINEVKKGNRNFRAKHKLPGAIFIRQSINPIRTKIKRFQKSNNANEIFNYSDILTEELIVLSHSYLEAYISDVLRIVYLKDSSLLNSESQFSWNEIKQEKDLKSLKESLIDKILSKSALNRIDEIIPKLRNEPLYLEGLRIDNDHLAYLKELRLLRNCIIHNGSRLSEEYRRFKKIRKHECTIHKHMNWNLVNNQYFLIKYVAFEIFVSVAVKYFNKNIDHLRKTRNPMLEIETLKDKLKEDL